MYIEPWNAITYLFVTAFLASALPNLAYRPFAFDGHAAAPRFFCCVLDLFIFPLFAYLILPTLNVSLYTHDSRRASVSTISATISSTQFFFRSNSTCVRSSCAALIFFSPYSLMCELRLSRGTVRADCLLSPYVTISTLPLSSFTRLSRPPCLRLPLGRTLSSTQRSIQIHCRDREQEYGYLSCYPYVVLSIKQVQSLVPAISTPLPSFSPAKR
jgi:hypothetical protein